jgi:hypothetical protein
MNIVNSYLSYLKKNYQHHEEKYLKPNKTLHFKTSDLYYYFHLNTGDTLNFELVNDTFAANINLYKHDLFEDLDSTDNLYHLNADGSYTISILLPYNNII